MCSSCSRISRKRERIRQIGEELRSRLREEIDRDFAGYGYDCCDCNHYLLVDEILAIMEDEWPKAAKEA